MANPQATASQTELSLSGTEVSRVSFRAPPFWEADVDLWFLQVESQFITAGITADKTKFHSVISVLDTKILSYVSDLVRNPPTHDLYETLKKRILSRFAQSETARLKSIFHV